VDRVAVTGGFTVYRYEFTAPAAAAKVKSHAFELIE